ncbi:HupE / UreJ protein [Sphingomonas antarctica]|uniref:HupE/UreJ family protein n=1 Tax=Sphingomonas antarctica TaxID=2040274 RepID=UPI0039ECF0F8
MRWLLLALVLLFARPVEAHLTPNSEVQIDFGQREAQVDVIIPLGEYGYATGNPIDHSARSLDMARAFLTSRIRVTSPDGKPWTIAIESIEFVQIAGPPDLHAILRITPPPGETARRMTIVWNAVIDTVPSHFVLFVARSDFSAGKLNDSREVLGALQGPRRTLAIDRGDGRALKGLSAAISLGMEHIAEGHDHLLFLIALLLPAPLLAASGAWGGPRQPRDAVRKLALIVTAFTVGHSITLIGAAFFGWQLPAPPVEIGIAISILVSAIHAWRPIFPGREPVVAAGFGLVHGLAFATVVSRFGLGIGEKAASILGFNLGIEIVQLMVVIAIMPLLIMLSRTRWYPYFRKVGAGFAGIAATAWIVERVSGTPNPLAETIDAGLNHSLWLAGALVVLTLVALKYGRDRPDEVGTLPFAS